METKISRSLQFMAIVAMTTLLLVNNGFAETPNTNTAELNGPLICPHSMYRDRVPGNKPYWHMGPGYMRHAGGYGAMGYGRGMMGYGAW